MKHKLIATLLTALLVLAVSLTSATAEIVLPDVPALDLADMVDIAAIEAGIPQVTYRVENGELIAEGEIDMAILAIDGPNGYQQVSLTYHEEDGTWRAPCEGLSIEEGYAGLDFWSNEYQLSFYYYGAEPVHPSWKYTENSSAISIKNENNSYIRVSYPQAKYSVQYDIQGNLTGYEYWDKDSDSASDRMLTVSYDAEGNLTDCYVEVFASEYKFYSWDSDDGWTCDGIPCDPPAGYESLIGEEDIKAFMPPLVIAEPAPEQPDPELPEINLPDVPALELSDIDMDLAAIEQLLPQVTYRVENGELIAEGTNFNSASLAISDENGYNTVELTYHPEDNTWRAPCESLEIEHGFAQISFFGDHTQFCYQSDGYYYWNYYGNVGVNIGGNSYNTLFVSCEQGKYDANYNQETGELTDYTYHDKTLNEINWEDDKQLSVNYNAAGELQSFNVAVIQDNNWVNYSWNEDDGWTQDGAPCEAPAGFEDLKTAEDFKALMPPLVEKPEPVKPQVTWFPHNTLCAAGFYLKDEFPGLTDKWYNVVPVDISHDGATVIPLVASGSNILGSATVRVKGDKVTVTYDLNSYMKHIYNESDCLCWFTSVSDITTEFLNNPTPNAEFGKAVSISEDLNGQAVALLFICNRVQYRLPLDDKGTMPARYWSNSPEWVKYRENLRPLLEMVP